MKDFSPGLKRLACCKYLVNLSFSLALNIFAFILAKMADFEIQNRFREYCALTGTIVDELGTEQSLLGNFLRHDFVSLCVSNATFSDFIQHIEMAFKLSEIDKIDQSVPFLLIEDLIEVGSYSTLELLLPYLDEKSSLWISVIYLYKCNIHSF